MNFCHSDFEDSETKTKLTCVIMDDLYNDAMKPFSSLTSHEKGKFNKRMNYYIQNELGRENWKLVLNNHFNAVINSVFENKNFDPSKYHVPITNYEPELLLSDEQKAFLESQKMEKVEK